MTDKTPAEHVETLMRMRDRYALVSSVEREALTYAIERLSAPEPVAASREAIGPAKKTMTLNLTDEEMAALDELAAKQDLSKDRIFRQALKVYQLHVLDPELLAKLPSVQAGDEVREAAEDLARRPCETKDYEDMEPGCCGPCRARQALAAAPKPPLEGGWKPERLAELADFLDALQEWGCVDLHDQADEIKRFLVSDIGLEEYREAQP